MVLSYALAGSTRKYVTSFLSLKINLILLWSISYKHTAAVDNGLK